MAGSAGKLAASIGTPAGAPDDSLAADEVVVEVDTDEVDTEDEALEGEQETEETDEDGELNEDELPDTVKDILKKNRQAVREAEKKLRAAERKLAAKDKESQPDPETEQRADTFRGLFINQAAKTALAQAGLTGSADRFVRMLDLSAVEVDEDGTIDGLDEQIEEIKADFADLFETKEPRRRAPRVASSGKEAPAAPKSSADRLAAQLRGGR